MSYSPEAKRAEAAQRKRAQLSLTEFVRYTKPDYEFAAHHAQIIEGLEAVERGDCPRLMIEAPPRHGKSELVSRRFPSWFIGRNPKLEIMSASYNQDLADDFGRAVRNIVASPDYRNVFDDVTLSQDSRAANRWGTNHGGGYAAVGVEGSATGRGFRVGVIDDPFKDRADADSERKRDNVWSWYTSVFLTRQAPGASIIVCNTRWHEDDLTGRILEKAKKTGEHWETIKLPAINEYGQALWPERYPCEFLETMRATLTPREWLSLYQQTPTAEEGTQFKKWYFEQRWNHRPQSMNVYMFGDFAVTPEAGDFTEFGVFGVDETDRILVLDWWHGQTASDVWIERLLDMAAHWNPIRFVGESGVIRRSIEPILERRMLERRQFVSLEWLPSIADKGPRARAFEALSANRRVWFPETEWAARVVDQLLRFPAGTHDDAVDVCSLAGRYINQMWQAQKPKEPAKSLEDVWNQPMTIASMRGRRG